MPEPKRIKIRNVSDLNRSIDVHYSEIPNCPYCNKCPSDSDFSGWYSMRNDLGYRTYNIYILKYCPVCGRVSMIEYPNIDAREFRSSIDITRANHNHYPNDNPVLSQFPDSISDLSPDFVRIYHQSEKAELSGLSDVCGMGYRKALEFLVKDYAIRFHPDNAESIASAPLTSVIRNQINHNKIQTLLTRAAWLGNDETHYIRKHENYTVNDMKVFIRACLSYIDSELTCEEALSIEPV